MNELLVISGKGGTGKTSLLAAFAILAERAVLADCDVDAADLHLILAPDIRRQEPFRAGHLAAIRQDACTGCGKCATACRFHAVRETSGTPGHRHYRIEPLSCEGCGVCLRVCPHDAIAFPENECGTWSVSDTRAGPMVHARLHPGGENSGKLVATVREQAKALAKADGAELLLVDGPPGIGCPVIASLSGVDLALIVTEPTPSGEHDLKRVLDLTRHFGIAAAVCVNKWDLNPEQTERIEALAERRGATSVGRVGYGPAFTRAQIAGKSIVEAGESAEADAVRAVWERTLEALHAAATPAG